MSLASLSLIAFAVAKAADFISRLMPYRERLYRLALAQLRNTNDAEDAVQEVLIKAGRNAKLRETWLSKRARKSLIPAPASNKISNFQRCQSI